MVITFASYHKMNFELVCAGITALRNQSPDTSVDPQKSIKRRCRWWDDTRAYCVITAQLESDNATRVYVALGQNNIQNVITSWL